MLSVTVIVKNEARDIEACLESVKWADEIVVLDSGSTDGTPDICRRYTDKVFETDWPGYGVQKNRALEAASGPWILSLDADERVPPQLAGEIRDVIRDTTLDAYEIARRSFFCGRAMRYGGWWPDYKLRLFKKNAASFSDRLVHEKVEFEGDVGRLKNHLEHYSVADFSDALRKVDEYSSLNARMMFETGTRSSVAKAIARGIWAFLKTYVVRRGFLDGKYGFFLAVSNAEGVYYKYIKLIRLRSRVPPAR